MTADERGLEAFDVESFARRLYADALGDTLGELTFIASTPGPARVVAQFTCTVGTASGNIVSVHLAAPAEQDAERWLREYRQLGATSFSEVADVGEEGFTFASAMGLDVAYRKGRYVFNLRVQPQARVTVRADEELLRRAALASLNYLP